jgi:hypothetical protein
MFKNVLLAGALLVPVLAYGGSPSTDLSVQIVPAVSTTPPPPSPTPPPPPTSGSCGAAPVGAAASDVTAAGFTTCALYSDWTYGIPNSVGTGLPSNWLDCSETSGTTPNADWTWGQAFFNYDGTAPCSITGGNSIISEATDGNGNPALHVQLTQAQLATFGGWLLSMGPYNPTASSASTPASWDYPLGVYIEYTMKDSGTNINGYSNEMAFWTVSNSNYGSGCLPSPGNTIELDFNESITPSYATYYMHCPTGGTTIGGNSYGFTISNYTTYGYLITNDGNNNLATCVYINGTRQFCYSATTPDSQGAIYGRMSPWFYASFSCGSSCTGTEDTWIKYIKVYTCSNWLVQNNAALSSCSGTANNGNFWVPSGQQTAHVMRPPRHHQ